MLSQGLWVRVEQLWADSWYWAGEIVGGIFTLEWLRRRQKHGLEPGEGGAGVRVPWDRKGTSLSSHYVQTWTWNVGLAGFSLPTGSRARAWLKEQGGRTGQ